MDDKSSESVRRINDDPEKRKAFLRDLDELLKRHGIESTEGLFGAPGEKPIKGEAESTYIVTIVS